MIDKIKCPFCEYREKKKEKAMEYSRQFIDQKEKDDFIAKIRGICEQGHSEQLDYQKSDGFRRWLYFTPKFSPSGFVILSEVASFISYLNSLKVGWKITIEMA